MRFLMPIFLFSLGVSIIALGLVESTRILRQSCGPTNPLPVNCLVVGNALYYLLFVVGACAISLPFLVHRCLVERKPDKNDSG